MSSVLQWFSNNAIRLVVCIVLLALGAFLTKLLRDRRARENLWLISIILTVASVAGVWFALSGTVHGDDGMSGGVSKRSVLERRSNEGGIEVSDGNGLFVSQPLVTGSEIVVDDEGVLFGTGAVPGSSILYRLNKRACAVVVCTASVGHTNSPSFLQKNKTRLITTSTTGAAGGGGSYGGRKTHKKAIFIGIFITIIVVVALWFLIGEDTGANKGAD